jgi:glycosyltransferase involved in cell wall biosynthesis
MRPETNGRGAIFVMPRTRAEGPPLAALWTLAAGWAAATRRRYGNAWIVTLDGVASPEEVLSFADPSPREPIPGTPRFARTPMVLRTAVKDVVRARRGRALHTVVERPEWAGHEIAFVWQHHSLFQPPLRALASRQRCPLVSFVDAPQVWEARRWGVSRPGWGTLVERFGEAPQLRASDVVACVSEEVAHEVRRFGVDAQRIVVSPMAVDAEQFTPDLRSGTEPDTGTDVRRALGLAGAFVVGWAGTFRRFQGLESLVEGFARFGRDHGAARLLLVGDGAERARVEELSDRIGIRDSVVFTGAIPARDVPAHLRAMDVAVVSARSDVEFHYSPLKLREYLACGCAALAPRAGEIPGFVTDGVHARLYTAGDPIDLAAKLHELAADPECRAHLGENGRALVVATATWDVRLTELVEAAAFRAAVDRLSRSA